MKRMGLHFLRQGIGTQMLGVLILFALCGRVESDFFHTHEFYSSAVPSLSAPCNACDVEATSVLIAPAPPVLPPLTVAEFKSIVPNEAWPFTTAILQAKGRAPPLS